MDATVEWRVVEGQFKPFVQRDGQEIAAEWAPQPGSQQAFLECPITEVLYEGTRGPGKTDALLIDFSQHVGKGYGAEWKGVLFRKTYPELQDVIEKSRKWFSRIWTTATFNAGKSFWEWPSGELLYFRHFAKPSDYWKYHGHAYPWIGWEELTTWPDNQCFRSMFACSRSTRLGMPRKVRATTNPYGVGHNWIKKRYRLPVLPGQIIGPIITDSRDESGQLEPERVAIHGSLDENQILMRADPGYKQRISAAARNASERKAWLDGSWDIVAGGMVDDVWDRAVHCIEPFVIPKGWILDRAFDWGSSKPFALGWWAESDGTKAPNEKVYPKGTLFLIAQWYGWNGKENEGSRMLAVEIARKGLEMEQALTKVHGVSVQAGPADPSIFASENGVCIASDMAVVGMRFQEADAGPGSRINGAERVRKYLKASLTWPMEEPGLFVFSTCAQWLRTVPVIPRDLKKVDDVDCFVAGTLVQTQHGQTPIESIAVGDHVQTPIGWCRVLKAGSAGFSETYRVQLSNGQVLEGTGDHKIYIEGRGLVPLCRVYVGDEPGTKERTWLNGTRIWASCFVDTLVDGILNAGHRVINALAPRSCIVWSGRASMALSHLGTISTTSTMTDLITALRTWNWSLRQSMGDTIPKSDLQTVGISGHVWINGERVRMDKLCFARILRHVVRTLPSENVRALIVGALLQRSIRLGNIAQSPVTRSPDERGTKLKRAVSAAWRSWLRRIEQKKPKLAVTHVDGPCGVSEVFFLTVEQAHLFYANSVLSANTESEDHDWDMTRYRVNYKRSTIRAQKLSGV